MAIQTWTSGTCTVEHNSDTKTITIKPTDGVSGAMVDYGNTQLTIAPWLSATSMSIESTLEETKTLTIENGVTYLGKYSFFSQASDTIGSNRFVKYNFTKIFIPGSVEIIGDNFYSYSYTHGDGSSRYAKRFTGFVSISMGDGVKSIGKEAFAFRRNIRINNDTDPYILNFPSSIESIGDDAFCMEWSPTDYSYPNGSISEVNFGINSKLIHIGARAFNYNKISKIKNLPNSFESFKLGDTFLGNPLSSLNSDEDNTIDLSQLTNLKEISLSYPKSYSINTDDRNDWQVDVARKFTKVILSDTLENICDSAFSWCTTLIDINLPSSIKTIGNKAFEYCEALSQINLPQSLESIGNDAFYYCRNLNTIKDQNQNDLIISGNITLGTNTFSYTGFTGKLEISDSVIFNPGNSKDEVFLSGTIFSSAIIGEGCTYPYLLNCNAFSRCKYIIYKPKIEIPSDITSSSFSSINFTIFAQITSQKIYLDMTEPSNGNKSIEDLINLLWKAKYGTKTPTYEVLPIELTVPIEYTSNNVIINYIPNIDLSEYNLVLSGTGNMANYSSIDELPWRKIIAYINKCEIGNNISSLSDYCFYGAKNLELSFPIGNIIIIGNNTFVNCSLVDIDNLSKTELVSIGNNAFKGTKLTNLELPDTLVSIGNNAFADITTITNTELKIPASVTSIGSNFVTCDTVYNVMNMAKTNQTVASDAFVGLTQEGLLFYGYTENENYKTVAADKWRDLANVAIMAPIMINGMIVYPPTKDKCISCYDNMNLEDKLKAIIARIEALESAN